MGKARPFDHKKPQRGLDPCTQGRGWASIPLFSVVTEGGLFTCLPNTVGLPFFKKKKEKEAYISIHKYLQVHSFVTSSHELSKAHSLSICSGKRLCRRGVLVTSQSPANRHRIARGDRVCVFVCMRPCVCFVSSKLGWCALKPSAHSEAQTSSAGFRSAFCG